MLEHHLESYLTKLKQSNARVTNWLSDGTELTDEFAVFPEISIPEDLHTFWANLNGVSEPQDTTLEYLWLDGQFMFYSIDQSLSDYKITLNLINDDPEFAKYWPIGFLPIGTPGDGSRLLVNCVHGSPTYGSVYELFHGDGISRLTKSLSKYFLMLDQLFDSGTIKVLESGEIEIDFDEYREKGRDMNPGCDRFDDNISIVSPNLNKKPKKRSIFDIFRRT